MSQDETSQSDRRSTPGPDWLAWSLQLILGLLVGSGVGFSVARLLFRSGFTSFDQMFVVAAGVALCCGAFASFYGDRAWMSHSIFDSPEPRQPKRAPVCSVVIGSVGAALVLGAVALHLITRERPVEASPAHGFSILPLVLAAIPGFLLIHALRTGTGVWSFGELDRYETPLFFWVYVFVNALGVMCLLFGT